MLQLSQLQYLPLPLPFFSILVGAFLLLVALVEVGLLRYAYMRLGLSSTTAFLLLLASLVGSYFNIGVAQLPAHQVLSGQEVSYFGMRYVVPVVVNWPGTVIAINVGGALIPGLISLYLIVRNFLWVRAAIVVAIVTVICHALASPVPGLGIALPVYIPSLAAAGVSLLLFRGNAAPLAYVGGSLGTLIGADLPNLGKIAGLGAPVASIGGAGTFAGIFLSGVMAVLIASLFPHSAPPEGTAERQGGGAS